MNVLVNFAPLKGGGGQNVALNFLIGARRSCPPDVRLVYAVARGSEVHAELERQSDVEYRTVPRNPLLRILHEAALGWIYLRRLRIDIIYSYFGYGCYPRRWPQVSGSADSNLYFPEVRFWAEYSFLARMKRWLVDRYRIFGVKRAQAVVFENSVLEARSRELFKLPQTITIRPSIAIVSADTSELPPAIGISGFKGLFLCGWHKNKRASLIPELAAELKRRGRQFTFILTAPCDGSAEHRRFVDAVRRLDVADMVAIIGPVKKQTLKDLYAKVDVVFLLSLLESFSNTIIESWAFERPLIIANEPWARGLCGDAAAYVNRQDVGNIIDTVTRLMDSEEWRRELVAKGREALRCYPSIDERVRQELDYLRQVFDGL